MSALKAAIEEYFKTDWNKTDVPSSVWRNEHGRLSTYPGYYSCTLTLHLNKSVTAQAVAQIEMPGVEKDRQAFGEMSLGNTVSFDDIKFQRILSVIVSLFVSIK
ncbi:unnamed protein product [Toxocara canis]|uniref:Type II secretion system protein n=1 Tax=Toxocara canis TaxID=6265 RepID=A0A183U4E1_TOXCA|nr:unnamed protein product [Toxocara canis]